MIDRGKHNVVGVHVDAVDYDAAVEKIIRAAQRSEPLSVAAVSVHGVMISVLDKTHRYRLNKLDLRRARRPARSLGPQPHPQSASSATASTARR